MVSSWVRPLFASAARNYIAGDTIGQALHAAEQLAARGLPSTLGYSDATGESPDEVRDRYVEALRALAPSPLDSYLSIKLPSLGYDEGRLRIDQVARELYAQLLEIGLTMLHALAANQGDGDAGAELACVNHLLRRLAEPLTRRYLSIFGELLMQRRV